MSDILINLDVMFGSIQLVSTERREGMDLVIGGYSITRDRNGAEVSRTENQDYCRLENYYNPECWGYSPSLWVRLKRWIRNEE